MKKTLLALAVLGAFTGIASAQSSVTIYGIVDTSIASWDDGAQRTTGIDSGRNAASRLGFKGSEDLGGGLKAVFLLEAGIRTDTGAFNSAGFNRLSYVGLEGNFGAVRLGRQDSPYRTALNVIDPFNNSGMGGAIDWLGYPVSTDQDAAPERVSNQVTYLTPKFGGFSGSVSYNFGETAGDTSANSGYAAQAGYANGPLNIQFAYANQNATAAGPSDEDTKNTLLGATYNFGPVMLHGGYKEGKIEDKIAGNDIVKTRSYLLGVTVPFGASKIRASYIDNSVKNVANADSKFYALSYTYALSKRTTLYTTYVGSNNDAASDMMAVTGENGSGFAVGIQHNF